MHHRTVNPELGLLLGACTFGHLIRRLKVRVPSGIFLIVQSKLCKDIDVVRIKLAIVQSIQKEIYDAEEV